EKPCAILPLTTYRRRPMTSLSVHWSSRPLSADEKSDNVYPEDPPDPGAVLVRPAGMVAGVTADEGALVEAQAMGIAGARFQGHLLQHFAGLWIIFGHALDTFRIPAAAVGGGEPDEALIVKGHVMTAHRIRGVIADADGVVDGPGVGIHPQHAVETAGNDPELAVMPLRAMGTASAQRDLLHPAGAAGIHVQIVHAGIGRRIIGLIVGKDIERGVTDRQPARDLRSTGIGFQHSAIPVHEPDLIGAGLLGHAGARCLDAFQLLLADPDTRIAMVGNGKTVGIEFRRLEQLGGLGAALGYLLPAGRRGTVDLRQGR